MNKNVVIGLIGVAGLSSMAVAQSGTAPTANQTWETRYQIQRFGLGGELLSTSIGASGSSGLIDTGTGVAYATDVSVGSVLITLQGRVAIRRPAGSTFSTTNLGIGRLAGPNTGTNPLFRLSFVDSVSQAAGLSQGTIGRGATGEGNDNSGLALTGAYSPFRAAFITGGAADADNVGRNSDSNNGIFSNPANGTLVASGITAGRGFFEGAFGGAAFAVGSGGVSETGDLGATPFANYYTFSYTPRFTPGAVNPDVNNPRLVAVSSIGQTAQYIFSLSGNLASSGALFRIPDFNFSFAVPTPGAAALLGLGGLVIGRRRR